MASKGQSLTVLYKAYNTSSGAYATGDVANHTIWLVKDGSAAVATNSPAEVDSTHLPGIYSLVLTSTECNFNVVLVGGKSSTANVIIIGPQISFENLPTAAPAASGGVLTFGTGTGQLNPSSGNVTVGTNNDKTGYSTTAADQTNVANALLDQSNGVETGVTVRQALRVMGSALGGQSAGAATTTMTYQGMSNAATTRITATVDSNGNRTSVTLSP